MMESLISQRQRNVLVVSDGKRGPSATQKISFAQPFDCANGLSSIRMSFETAHSDPAKIAAAMETHRPCLLILSRVTSDSGRQWIDSARSAGIPVVFHIDDDLLAVPASLGAAKFNAYNNPERLAALRENIEASDLVYVSTPELEKRFRRHGIKAPIFAGNIYCSVPPAEVGALLPPASGPVIGYMGTGGHSADLAMVLPAICHAMDAIPTLQFEVFGTIAMPGELLRFGRRVRHLPPVQDYSNFIPFLRSLGWWVGLAPLEDNEFNRCKADTKWVEYSLAGMAVVASDLPVYRNACAGGAGILAFAADDWERAMSDLVLRPALRASMIENAQAKLRRHYGHDRLRAQVIEVMKSVSSSAMGEPAILGA